MPKTPVTAELLRKINMDKQTYGTHDCCGRLVTGPHSSECRELHPGPYYA